MHTYIIIPLQYYAYTCVYMFFKVKLQRELYNNWYRKKNIFTYVYIYIYDYIATSRWIVK